jgi:hypothetical protein
MYAAEQTWPARSPMMVNEHGREGNPRDLIVTDRDEHAMYVVADEVFEAGG